MTNNLTQEQIALFKQRYLDWINENEFATKILNGRTPKVLYQYFSTEEKMLETIRYFEDESDGSYYISGISLNDVSTEEGNHEYTVGMTITLYYFNSEENMGLPATATESSAA